MSIYQSLISQDCLNTTHNSSPAVLSCWALHSAAKRTGSGVARAFPGGRLAHPEGQNEEEKYWSLRKTKKSWLKFEEKMRKLKLLPTRDCEAGYGPAHWRIQDSMLPGCRGVRGIFFRGGQSHSIFPGVKCFFPVENSHFGRPKTNFSGFEKWKEKKKVLILYISFH